MNGQQFVEMIQLRKDAYRGAGRNAKLKQFAQVNGVTLEEVVVVINRDLRWPERCNRTESEARAHKIGQTNSTTHGYPEEIVWAYVKK